jgi:trans-aconitate methyltransferase
MKNQVIVSVIALEAMHDHIRMLQENVEDLNKDRVLWKETNERLSDNNKKLQEEVDKWYKAFQDLTKSHIEKSNDAREYRQLFDEYKARYEFTLGRVNGLEEWLTEYRDQLKAENVYHKNTGIINAINELLNDNL